MIQALGVFPDSVNVGFMEIKSRDAIARESLSEGPARHWPVAQVPVPCRSRYHAWSAIARGDSRSTRR